jgi:hypothetical protein
VLAVEVAGADEGDSEKALREKADWYLGGGIAVVWDRIAPFSGGAPGN